MQGVLTLAGEGTRMLPWTRGLRKEFLPLYDRGIRGEPVLKPVAHLALESLTSAGAEEITLVVRNRDLTMVQNYFTIDRPFLRRHAHHRERLTDTERFYQQLHELRLRYAVQPQPSGFGDAVLRAEPCVGVEPFLLHAADAVLLEAERGRTLRTMAALREREGLDAVLLVRKVAEPSRYGVVEGSEGGREGEYRRLDVTRIVEKPARPRSRWAATALYAFSSRMFPALRAVARSERPRELEVTAGIARMLADGGRVVALVLTPRLGEWRSVGSAAGYLEALTRTRRLAERAAPRRGKSPRLNHRLKGPSAS
jgi:UTP--glucose-1-phosphate uridylyltransferase